MPSNNDRISSEDVFRKVEAKLALIRAAATACPDAPESWLKRTFNPAASSSRQTDFNVAIVDALEEAVTALRETVANREVSLEHLERDLTKLRELQERTAMSEQQLAQLRQEQSERIEQLGREQGEKTSQLSARQGDLGSELREKINQLSAGQDGLGSELREKINQLSAGQDGLRSELRERIQHLLDEQRICLRQLSLKTSEEAVLAERARRATELRLDELAQRVPKRPA